MCTLLSHWVIALTHIMLTGTPLSHERVSSPAPWAYRMCRIWNHEIRRRVLSSGVEVLGRA